jgi:hypothetical protein
LWRSDATMVYGRPFLRGSGSWKSPSICQMT